MIFETTMMLPAPATMILEPAPILLETAKRILKIATLLLETANIMPDIVKTRINTAQMIFEAYSWPSLTRLLETTSLMSMAAISQWLSRNSDINFGRLFLKTHIES